VNACATSSAINDGSLVQANLSSVTRVAGEAVAGSPYELTARMLQALSRSAARKHSASFSEPPNADHHTGADVTAIDAANHMSTAGWQFSMPSHRLPVMNNPPAATVSATMARPV
jgi:hypothetical protein